MIDPRVRRLHRRPRPRNLRRIETHRYDHERANSVDVVADLAALAAGDPHTHHRLVTDLPPQPKQLVFDTAGIIEMGQRWADWVIEIEPD